MTDKSVSVFVNEERFYCDCLGCGEASVKFSKYRHHCDRVSCVGASNTRNHDRLPKSCIHRLDVKAGQYLVVGSRVVNHYSCRGTIKPNYKLKVCNTKEQAEIAKAQVYSMFPLVKIVENANPEIVDGKVYRTKITTITAEVYSFDELETFCVEDDNVDSD